MRYDGIKLAKPKNYSAKHALQANLVEEKIMTITGVITNLTTNLAQQYLLLQFAHLQAISLQTHLLHQRTVRSP
jgi:hypothetical protein